MKYSILASLLLLVVVGASSAQTPSAVGTLRVKTDVAEARVILDEKEVGHTPLTLRDVSVGKHRLLILKDGFEDHSQEVDVSAVKTTSVFAVLKPESSQMPEVPVTFNVIHQHRLGKCTGKLTVTADALDYDAVDDSDKFHIPIATIKSLSRSWGPTAGLAPFGIRGPTDSMAFRVEAPGRSYGFLAYRDSIDDKMEVASEETKRLFTTVYKLWSATLKSPGRK